MFSIIFYLMLEEKRSSQFA